MVIERNKLLELCEYLQELNSVDVANQLMDLEDEELVLVFRVLPKDIAAEVFSYLDKDSQQHIVESITDREVTQIVDKLFLDDTVDFIEELPANVVKKVIRNTSPQKRELINQFLQYAQYSAGSIMTIEFVDLKAYMTVKEAINHTRKTGTTKETLETCFIIDQARHLLGSVTLKDLILSEDDMIIEDIMDTNLISVQTSVDQEEVAHLFKAYDLVTMPVVDKENRLVGMITIDDVVDIIEQENTEDFQKMAAMAPNEEPYLKTPVLSLAKHRIIWLLVLMFSATLTGSIITRYENAFQAVPLLVSFIPMLMDTGGNCGSQSSTLIIRGIALNEIRFKKIFKVMFKEFRIALVVGVILAIANGLRIYVMYQDLNIAFVIALSLIVTVILSKLIGCILPLVANQIGLDPAIMASPLITTIVDTCSILVYFNIAVHIFNL